MRNCNEKIIRMQLLINEVARIKPPSPQEIWRFSSAHFSGKQFSKQTICGTISPRLYRQESTIGKEQNTNHT